MEKIGIICEYNPFHNGHLYHLNKIKEKYPDSLIVLVMSGYFTERGEISMISKYNKTRIAIKYGVDIVLELPTLYSVNSADYFADSAIKILNEVGIEKLVFGSESDDVKILTESAKMQIDNPKFDTEVKVLLSKGINYPTALSKATGILLGSNDLLGISYIKSIIKNNYDIIPITIKRTNDFNDLDSCDDIISASNIREKYKNGLPIHKFIPPYDKNYINRIDEEKLFMLLKYKIITSNDLSAYLGVDEGLEYKLKKEINKSQNINQLLEAIKSKRYTYVRLQRMLIHILLGIKKEDMNNTVLKTRVLGFSKNGQEYLHTLKNNKFAYKDDSRIREIEMRASIIYYILTNDNSCLEEKLNKPVRL